jgi:hypothetical protein
MNKLKTKNPQQILIKPLTAKPTMELPGLLGDRLSCSEEPPISSQMIFK